MIAAPHALLCVRADVAIAAATAAGAAMRGLRVLRNTAWPPSDLVALVGSHQLLHLLFFKVVKQCVLGDVRCEAGEEPNE